MRFGVTTLLAAVLSVPACRPDEAGEAQPREQPSRASASAAEQKRTPSGSASKDLPLGRSTVDVEMRNVHLRLDANLALDIQHLRGRLVSVKTGAPPVFDDPSSYEINVDSARVALTAASLEWLMNTYVFHGPRAPLKDIKVGFEDGKLSQKGVMRKGVNIPFSVVAEVSAAPDGTLRIHTVQQKAAGMPAGGLLDFFGIELDDLISVRDTYGLRVEDNDIFVDPSRVLPPPRVRGHLTAARIDGSRLVQVFGPGQRSAGTLAPPAPTGNYLYFKRGTLRFGRLTMNETDLQLIDADPKDPFDFFPRHYEGQLVAGYSKNTRSGGLMTFMPDHDELIRNPRLDLTRGLRRIGSSTAGR
jgi:hypothetical protein